MEEYFFIHSFYYIIILRNYLLFLRTTNNQTINNTVCVISILVHCVFSALNWDKKLTKTLKIRQHAISFSIIHLMTDLKYTFLDHLEEFVWSAGIKTSKRRTVISTETQPNIFCPQMVSQEMRSEINLKIRRISPSNVILS